jgi:hypothetical protein
MTVLVVLEAFVILVLSVLVVGLLATASQYRHDSSATDERSVDRFRECSRFWGTNLQNRTTVQLSEDEVASDQLTGYSYET